MHVDLKVRSPFPAYARLSAWGRSIATAHRGVRIEGGAQDKRFPGVNRIQEA